MKRTESTSSAEVLKKTQPEEFDLVILGGGTGSTIAAWTFAGEGKQVAVVERKYTRRGMPEHRVLAEQEHHPQRESRIVLSPKQGIRNHMRWLRDRHGGSARTQTAGWCVA
jgi:choline dehydrogenase-like flavoprotein